MNETVQKNDPERRPPAGTNAARSDEPGLLDTVGSFPVWLLKIIQFFTPESLITKTPPPKKKIRY